MQHEPAQWGRPRRDHVLNDVPVVKQGDFMSGSSFSSESHGSAASVSIAPDYLSGAKTHTQRPIVTGTSVLAVVYCDGIMMTTDCLASYGTLARFRNVERMAAFRPNTLLGSSGDLSDFQYMTRILKHYEVAEYCFDDGHNMTPRQWFTNLARYMYYYRSKFSPLWNSHVVGGVDTKTGEKFLGFVDLLGTTYESKTIATGFGAYLAQPILREAVESRETPLSEAEATKLLVDCMRVLYYRDARSLDKIQMAKATAQGVEIGQPFKIDSNWDFALNSGN